MLRNNEQVFALHTFTHITSVNQYDYCYRFTSSSQYFNLKDIIGASPQWALVSDNYSFFRVDSVNVEISPVFNPSIGTLGANTLPSPSLYLDFFPTITSSSKVFTDLYPRDTAMVVSSFNRSTSDCVYSIPKHFTSKFGTMLPVTGISNLPGEFIVSGYTPVTTGLVATVCFEIMFTVYVTVSNDKA
jgi:hypothetical protein